MAKVRDGKARSRPHDEEEADWRGKVRPSVEDLARLRQDVSALIDRLEKQPESMSSKINAKFESVGFMTKNGKPKWKRAYIVLQDDKLMFHNSRSKVPFAPLPPIHQYYLLAYSWRGRPMRRQFPV